MQSAATKLTTKIRLPSIPSIRDIIRLYKLRALRQLSQNFLLNDCLNRKIVNSAGKVRDAYVIEVGPGPGSITRAIIEKKPKHLTVVEKDSRFIPILQHLKNSVEDHVPLSIEIADIFNYDLQKAFNSAPIFDWHDYSPPIHIIGNLPFNVATHLIIRWLSSISRRESIWSHGRVKLTLTFQKEVAQRIVAPILSDQRCRLSVISQLWCQTKHHFDIPGAAFLPKPDVDVGVVTFTPLVEPFTDLPFHFVERIIRQVFNMRQKYSIRGAQTLFPEDLRLQLSRELFELAELNPKMRPFEISNEEFVRLAVAYKILCREYPSIEHYDLRAPKKKTLE